MLDTITNTKDYNNHMLKPLLKAQNTLQFKEKHAMHKYP